jgi:hypothetical protein
MTNIDKKFITGYFLEAARNTRFHHVWMSVDTWAELIVMYYQLAPDLIFTGSDLVEAIRRLKWLDPLIDSERTIKEDLCLYKNKHRPKRGKQI